MAGLIFTQEDLDALKEAWLTGAKSVQIGDKRIDFDSRKDLEARMKVVQEYLAGEQTESSIIIPATYSKGES